MKNIKRRRYIINVRNAIYTPCSWNVDVFFGNFNTPEFMVPIGSCVKKMENNWETLLLQFIYKFTSLRHYSR